VQAKDSSDISCVTVCHTATLWPCGTIPLLEHISPYLLASAPLSGSGVAEVLRTTPGVEDAGDTIAEPEGGFNGDWLSM
jgi:hypothetical protein